MAEAFCSASGPEKTAAICYAVGWTQHSDGVQIIRTAAILQLLLGNIGRPGGGILALRGHASIQGSTDIPTLYDILPGYLPMPFFESRCEDRFEHYIQKHKTKTGWWNNFDKYIVSLLKAYYGDAATKENSIGFRLASARYRRSFASRLLVGNGGRQHRRAVCDGTKSRGGRAEFAPRTQSAGEAEMAGSARHGGNRNGIVLAGLARGRARRTGAGGN